MSDLTEDERLYAVGDVHGRLDLLTDMLARIRADLDARPHPRPRIVMLGDYVDRGPDSRGVIDALIALRDGDLPATFLRGNHDAYVLAYLADPLWADLAFHWLAPNLGGNATLASYGVPDADQYDPEATHAAFAAALPPTHRAFIEDCALTLRIGGYLFVHAGIRPGVPLGEQDPQDLIWIREPFLTSAADFGFKVVHGHTIVPQVEHHRNRIAVDTGAVRSGVLSCVVLEGDRVDLLRPDGPAPLPVGGAPGLWRSLWMRR